MKRTALFLLIAAAVVLNLRCYSFLYREKNVREGDAVSVSVRYSSAIVRPGTLEVKRNERNEEVSVAIDGEHEAEALSGKEQDNRESKKEEQEIVTENKVEGETGKNQRENGSEGIGKVNVKEVLTQRFGNLSRVNLSDFIANYYIVDSSTLAVSEDFDIELLAEKRVSVAKKDNPQILIYHTHSSEAFADSRPGCTEDTVVGAGELLAQYLREEGWGVLHLTEIYDRKADGSDDRANAYNNTLPDVKEILAENPQIEVVIDLHRDSGEARRATVNGTSMAKIMLFNGLCRTKDGPITYYSNANLTGNLAFSLQTQITGNELYPGLMHRIYLKSYRYNMHLKGNYLLVELGTEKNTVAEAMAAMKPFARILSTVLSE